MILIADSSALIALSVCDGLELLEQLFDDIKVPQAVYDEIVLPDKGESSKLKLFLENRVLQNISEKDTVLEYSIGFGEYSAMLLYKRMKADNLLVDDKRARKVAQANNINIIGSLGILMMAKKKGIIKRVAPFMEKIAKSNVFIKKEVYHYVLKITGEL